MIDTPWCASAPSLSHLPMVLMDLVSERDDKDCVGEALAAYALDHPTASMLVAWEMVRLPDIAEALGAGNVPEWPAKWYVRTIKAYSQADVRIGTTSSGRSRTPQFTRRRVRRALGLMYLRLRQALRRKQCSILGARFWLAGPERLRLR